MKSDDERWAEWEQWQRMAAKSVGQFAKGFFLVMALIVGLPVALLLLHLAPVVAVGAAVVAWWMLRSKSKDGGPFAWCETCQAVAPVDHVHKGRRS